MHQRAYAYVPEVHRRYFAQLKAYQIMPDSELLTIREVCLNMPVGEIISRAGVRVNCAVCGEEIINEREMISGETILCRSCAGQSYYQAMGQFVPIYADHCAVEAVER